VSVKSSLRHGPHFRCKFAFRVETPHNLTGSYSNSPTQTQGAEMPSDDSQGREGSLLKTSRRRFLEGAAAFGVTGTALARARRSRASSTGRPILAYVGTYSSSSQGPEGGRANGKGIYLYEMNPATGALTQREVFADALNPSWLALDPSRTHLYAAEEVSNFQGTDSGAVSAFSIEPSSGHLKLLNTVSSRGAGPAHLSVHPSGKYVLVANYGGGTVAVLPIQSNGSLGSATDVKHDEGTVGSKHATSAPPGSFAISGHDHPHAHMVEADPAGRFVLVNDLGLDRIMIWKFDSQTGQLSPNQPASVALPSGDGPRHFAFHPHGRWFYSLQEEASTIVMFDYDATRGRLTARQTVSSLPKGFAGTNFTSEIAVSPDGEFVYAANRLHDSIGVFAIGGTGTLTPAGEAWTRGDYPRSFGIDPGGNFLYSCNQRSDAITTFRINRETGALTFTGQYTPVGTPAIIVFLA
jgi:6-phosphogluconolactonase